MYLALQILELDAEIKHAFEDLQLNEEACQKFQSQVEALSAQLQDSRTCLHAANEEIKTKTDELEAAVGTHRLTVVTYSVS